MKVDDAASLRRPTFIDLFAGCGGLSLGLCQAGWKGLFAIERAADAFKTFEANFLVEDARFRFAWPEWIERKAHSIDEFLDEHQDRLKGLRNTVDLIAGGPPCQGFSFAGKRNASDPRNKMFERYVAFVALVRPKFLVLENVPGMNVAHVRGSEGGGRSGKTYYEKLLGALNEIDYVASGSILDAPRFAVPQRRQRLVVVGMRGDIARSLETGSTGVFQWIAKEGDRQLASLSEKGIVTARDAISDLHVGTAESRHRRTKPYRLDDSKRGFRELRYKQPKTAYQRAMNEGVAAGAMDSMRLPNHKDYVVDRFELILDTCRKGVNINAIEREELGLLKHRTVPMAANAPAPTLTTLPDDILHYKEPRILTVREYARLQSFPDWFAFKGKYTTGGDLRRTECPRYTQVGNAVPPLLAQAVGAGILAYEQVGVLDSGFAPKNIVESK